MEYIIWLLGGIGIVFIIFRVARKNTINKDAHNSFDEFYTSFNDEQIEEISESLIDILHSGERKNESLGRIFDSMSIEQRSSWHKYNTRLVELLIRFIDDGRLPSYDSEEELLIRYLTTK